MFSKLWNGLFGRHPRGLPMLFFSEMWERFSFYGMRALLVLYMVKKLGYDEEKSYGIYAAYGALVYAFPVLGGALANAVLGYRRSILFGGTLMAIGQMILATPGDLTLYAGLAFLCVGNGFFKPNISSTVGELYEENDKRSASGFTIFYMGVNLGAFLAPLICGPLGENVSWSLGFGLAGIGMAVGLITFLLGKDRLEGAGEAPDAARLQRLQAVVLGGAIALVPLTALLLYWYAATKAGLLYAMVAIFGYILWVALKEEDRIRRSRLLSLMILMIFHAFFWGLFEQAGSSLTLYADRCIDRHGISTSMMQAINPFFILVFAPFFSSLWLRLSERGTNPSIPVKFAYGLIQLGLGFAALNLGNSMSDDTARTGLIFLVLAYLLHTTGELCLSPIGLSAVTKLAPQRITGFVMGSWFLTISLGHVIAGEVAKMTNVDFEANPALVALSETKYRLPAEGGLDDLVRLEGEEQGETLAVILPRLIARNFPASGVMQHGVDKKWFGADAKAELDKLQLDSNDAGRAGEKIREFLAGEAFTETLLAELVASKYVVDDGAKPGDLRKGAVGAMPLTGYLEYARSHEEEKLTCAQALDIAVGKGLLGRAIADDILSKIQTGGGDDKAVETLDKIVVGPIKERYDPVYFYAFVSAVAAGVLLLLLSPFVRGMMHGVE